MRAPASFALLFLCAGCFPSKDNPRNCVLNPAACPAGHECDAPTEACVDVTPGVRIAQPPEAASVPAGRDLKVSFQVYGKDGGVPFKLVLDLEDRRRPGQGMAAAFVDTGANSVALTHDPSLVVPGASLPAGLRRISIVLRYNDGSSVMPQYPGEVRVVAE